MAASTLDPPDFVARRAAFAELKRRFTGGPGAARLSLEHRLASGVPHLDALLHGGFENGLVTLEGRPSAGCWSLATRLLAQVTRRGLAAVIDSGALYPPTLEQSGVRLERLLVIPAQTPLAVARAADIVLRSRICSLVVLPAVTLSSAVWARLAGLAHRGGALLLVLASRANTSLAIAASVRLSCALDRVVFAGTRGLWSTLAGYTLRAELRKHKGVASSAVASA